MATFLQLCRDVARESGTISSGSGTLPQTVVGQTGRLLKVVKWVAAAWERIQNDQNNWRFMQKEFSHAHTIGEQKYAATDLGITDFAEWFMASEDGYNDAVTIYDPSIGQADENSIRFVEYGHWNRAWNRGSHDANRPNYWSIDRENRLVLGPKPDKAYILRGPYRRTVQTLAADNDTPICAARFHAAITYRALMLMDEHDEGVANIAFHKVNYDDIIGDMMRDELPMIRLAGPLA